MRFADAAAPEPGTLALLTIDLTSVVWSRRCYLYGIATD